MNPGGELTACTGWTWAGGAGGTWSINPAATDAGEDTNIGGEPVSNLESLLITRKLDLVSGTSHKQGPQKQFRKYEPARVAAGEVGKNTLPCLGETCPEGILPLTLDEKLLEGKNSYLFQSVFIRAVSCTVNSTGQDEFPRATWTRYLTALCLSLVILTSVGPVSRKVTAVSAKSLLQL